MSEISHVITEKVIKNTRVYVELGIQRDTTVNTTGWQLYDSALTYFEKQYLGDLQALQSPDIQTLKQLAEVYDRLFPRVVAARQILEQNQPSLMCVWRESDGSLKQATTESLAAVLARESSYCLGFGDEDELAVPLAECGEVVQWLDGWIQSELVDQQG